MSYGTGNVGGAGVGCGNQVGGLFNNVGVILVLFILLVIIACTCMF